MTAPDVFELDEDEVVRLRLAQLPPELETAARAGARVLPVHRPANHSLN